MVESGRRSGRAAARRAAAALATPRRHAVASHDDETMPDAKIEAEPSPLRAADEDEGDGTDKDNNNSNDNDDAEEDLGDEGGDEEGGEEEEEAEEQPHSDGDGESGKSPSPTPVMMVRRKRLGRPPKNRPPDWDPMVEVPASESEVTPAARRRGRGGWRGRGGRKGQMQPVHQQPVDKDGNLMDIVNDEVDLPEDSEGETKVDKDGNLLGGREYRCRTFTVAGRGGRLYMLSTEPARCVGFRDSYLFFTKHRRLYKIIVDDEEKRDMIERDIIPHSYKGRAIGIVTARSVFREFGALIVVGGRRITDDYEVAKAREEGAVEGELADPNDRHIPGEPYNKNQYVAWHGASSVYHSNAPPVPQQSLKLADSRKRRAAINDHNWQFEHAREASNFNSILASARMPTLDGVYDIHTNMMHYPASMQPQRARAVQVSPDEEAGFATSSSTFPPLPPHAPQNFLVTDIYLETPPVGIAPVSPCHPSVTSQGPGGEDLLSPFQGLGAVTDEIKDFLPPECRKAFDQALSNEEQWSSRWGDEKDTMCRRDPIIDKAIVPYSMAL